MYYYIVDPQKISQKEFERVQNNLYSSLSEYRISGEVVRVTGLRTIQQLVENAFSHEAKTIVAVGNDQTLHQVINAVGKRDTVIGFIPIIKSEIGNIFGIKSVEQAVKIIASRRIELIDLGVVNNNYFLSKLRFGEIEDGWIPDLTKTFEVRFNIDDKYQAVQEITAGIIVNTREAVSDKKIVSPIDGNLDLLLLPELSKWKSFQYRKLVLSGQFENIPQASIVHAEKIEILSPEGMNLKAWDLVIAKTPAVIQIVPQALKIIVGRERKF